MRRRQKSLGPDAVRVAWVKAHVGTWGNEKADQMAISGAGLGNEEEGMNKVIRDLPKSLQRAKNPCNKRQVWRYHNSRVPASYRKK